MDAMISLKILIGATLIHVIKHVLSMKLVFLKPRCKATRRARGPRHAYGYPNATLVDQGIEKSLSIVGAMLREINE